MSALDSDLTKKTTINQTKFDPPEGAMLLLVNSISEEAQLLMGNNNIGDLIEMDELNADNEEELIPTLDDLTMSDTFNNVSNTESISPDDTLSNSTEFKISFTLDSVSLFKRLAEVLETHIAFRETVEDTAPLPIPNLERLFEQKLAMYIVSKILTSQSYVGLYIAYPDDIIRGINTLFVNVLNRGYSTFMDEHLLDGYPVTLLTELSGASRFHTHIIGESMRRFVEIRKTHPDWLPDEFHNVVTGIFPLTGHINSPLTQRELEALYRYLGAKKTIYVHILLNTLFELKEHEKRLNNRLLNEEQLCAVCKSSWLYLFLFASVQNAHINRLNSTNSGYESDLDYDSMLDIMQEMK